MPKMRRQGIINVHRAPEKPSETTSISTQIVPPGKRKKDRGGAWGKKGRLIFNGIIDKEKGNGMNPCVMWRGRMVDAGFQERDLNLGMPLYWNVEGKKRTKEKIERTPSC